MAQTNQIDGRKLRDSAISHVPLTLEPELALPALNQLTAIPLPIKLYVALRVGVAVILSQRPTPGTIEYSTNRFCGETYVLAGVLKSKVFKLCFGAKIFVPGKKLAKLQKEDDRRSQPAPTVGPTAPTVGPMQVSVHRENFNFSWRVAKSVLSSTVRRWNVKKRKIEGK